MSMCRDHDAYLGTRIPRTRLVYVMSLTMHCRHGALAENTDSTRLHQLHMITQRKDLGRCFDQVEGGSTMTSGL